MLQAGGESIFGLGERGYIPREPSFSPFVIGEEERHIPEHSDSRRESAEENCVVRARGGTQEGAENP